MKNRNREHRSEAAQQSRSTEACPADSTQSPYLMCIVRITPTKNIKMQNNLLRKAKAGKPACGPRPAHRLCEQSFTGHRAHPVHSRGRFAAATPRGRQQAARPQSLTLAAEPLQRKFTDPGLKGIPSFPRSVFIRKCRLPKCLCNRMTDL